MSKQFIGKEGLNSLITNVKNDLNEKINISDQITEEELLKTWNDVNGSEIPNMNSLIHNHDELYYRKEDIDEKLQDVSASKHNHDDLYYTETEVNELLDNKANKEHGIHVTYGTSTPKMDGTASVGTSEELSRADHIHPSDNNKLSITNARLTTLNISSDINSYVSSRSEANALAVGKYNNVYNDGIAVGNSNLSKNCSMAVGNDNACGLINNLYVIDSISEDRKTIYISNDDIYTTLGMAKNRVLTSEANIIGSKVHILSSYSNIGYPFSLGISMYEIVSVTDDSITINTSIPNDKTCLFAIVEKYNAYTNFSSFVTGEQNVVQGQRNFVAGYRNFTYGINSFSLGTYNISRTAIALGSDLISKNYQVCIGTSNKYLENNKFIIGNGGLYTKMPLEHDSGYRSNAFRVDNTGAVFAQGDYNSTGADFAEMFEYADGNPNGEDRIGRFVTLVGTKIRLANPSDKRVLGITSGAPTVVGDVYDDQWQGMYLYDIYGRPILEEVLVPEEKQLITNEDGTQEEIIIQPEHTEIRQKINPKYNPNEKYIPRSKRPEWDAVGLVGKLVLLDDGTCEEDGYCTTGENGIGTKSEEETNFYVMERLDSNHVRIMIYNR